MALKTLRPRLQSISTKAVDSTHQPKTQWGHGRGGRPWRRLRDKIFLRDKYTCQVCGRIGGDLELDHIVNVAKGGTESDSNLQTLCKSPCHAEKTHRESQEI